MKLEFLGTGTSTGVPQMGCDCEVCISPDNRDQRTRCSIWITDGPLSIVVDTGPDFRCQCLRSRIPRIDAVFYTHFHADHVFGVDDLRLFNFIQKEKIPVFVPDFMVDRFVQCFDYTIQPSEPLLSRPQFILNTVTDRTIQLGKITIEPVDIWHGREKVKGYIFSTDSAKIAYLIDCKVLPEPTIDKVTRSDIIIISALWKKDKQHPAHLNLDEAIAISRKLDAADTYFSHITHHMGLHQETSRTLPDRMHLAYDGLSLTLE